MSVNIVFFKYDKNSYEEVDSLAEADIVQVPVDEYISIEEWNSLIDQYELAKDQYEKVLKLNPLKKDEDSIVISKQTYNGFLKMLRILRDRSLQSIDRAKADQHGYTIKNAIYRCIDRNYPDLKACFITKTTPISLKIDAETAKEMIWHDFLDFYNYIDLSRVATPSFPKQEKIETLDILRGLDQQKDEAYKDFDFFVSNDDYGRKIKELIDGTKRAFVFEITGLHGNIGLGVYEVNYLATDII